LLRVAVQRLHNFPRRKWSTIPKAGWSLGCIAAIDSNGQTIWIVDAHRDDGKRFVVHADEKWTAFLELERAICIHLILSNGPE